MDLKLRDRVILVTGGSSGIGLATVAELRAEGALVATCARNLDRLRRALRDAHGDDAGILAARADVRDQTAVTDLMASVTDRFGRLDGLVNNAGQSRMKGVAEATAEDWRDELELKFASVLHPTMAALPLLRPAGGSIVNVNAVLAVQPDPRLVTTSAARAGVLNLSKSLADELAPDGIRVNSVCLGLIETGQWSRRWEADSTSLDYEAWQQQLAADRRIPMGRLGRSDEVAAMIAFLLSPRASYITGAAVDIAGGSNRHSH